MMRVLTAAGNYVPDDSVSSLIQMISEAGSLQAYIVQQLYKALKDDISYVSFPLVTSCKIVEET